MDTISIITDFFKGKSDTVNGHTISRAVLELVLFQFQRFCCENNRVGIFNNDCGDCNIESHGVRHFAGFDGCREDNFLIRICTSDSDKVVFTDDCAGAGHCPCEINQFAGGKREVFFVRFFKFQCTFHACNFFCIGLGKNFKSVKSLRIHLIYTAECVDNTLDVGFCAFNPLLCKCCRCLVIHKIDVVVANKISDITESEIVVLAALCAKRDTLELDQCCLVRNK